MPKTPRLREWRERATLSQEELKERSRISRATIADLEAGNRGAQPRTVRRLAAALGVEPVDLYGEPSSPKAKGPPSQEKLFENGAPEGGRHNIAINYNTCRAALERFCDHWQPVLSGMRRLDHQGFQDFKADAASLSGLARELMGAEMETLGQQYDEEGDPVFYTERSEFGPAVMRFHDLAIRMDKIGKESFDEDLTSDPEMGQLLDLFPKAS